MKDDAKSTNWGDLGGYGSPKVIGFIERTRFPIQL